MSGISFWACLLGLRKHLSVQTSATLSVSLCSIFQCPQKNAEIRAKQLTGWCSCWLLEEDVHAWWICPTLSGCGNLITSLYDLLASIGNDSCVWIACCFAFCFHPRMSRGRLLPLLWLWKDFVNWVSQRALLDSCSWRDGLAWERRC